jgi:phosphatidate phosphatase LPIN
MFKNWVSSFKKGTQVNTSTLSGCIDIVVVKDKNGNLKSTPFHVRFGKLKVLKTHDKVIELIINDKSTKVTMKLGKGGEAYFEEELGVPRP